MSHTPTPWTIQQLPHRNPQRTGYSYAIRDSRNCCLATVGEVDAIHDGAESEANTEYIVRAANSHEDLLAALRDIRQAYQDMFEVMPVAWQTFDEIAAQAIARATGTETPVRG